MLQKPTLRGSKLLREVENCDLKEEKQLRRQRGGRTEEVRAVLGHVGGAPMRQAVW